MAGFFTLLIAMLCLASYCAPTIRAESAEQASTEAGQRFDQSGKPSGAPIVAAASVGGASKTMADENKGKGTGGGPPDIKTIPSPTGGASASGASSGSSDKGGFFKDFVKDFPKGKWTVPLIAGGIMGVGIGVAAAVTMGALPGIGWALGATVGLAAFFRYLNS